MKSRKKTELTAQELYIKKQHQHKRTVSFSRFFIFVAFLLLWETASGLGWIDSFFFSSPSRVITCAYQMLLDGSLLMHTGVTLLETLLSFFLVFVLGISFALLLWSSDKLSEILEPYLVVLNSLPKSALAPLLIVWLGTGMKTIIVAGISVAIFGSVISLYTGFHEVDHNKLVLIRTLGGTKKDCLTKVVLPSSIPTIISTIKVNIGLALVGVIIGEFLAARRGLGYLIIYGSQVFQLHMVIMSIIILCVIALMLYQGIQLLEKIYKRHI